MVLNLVNKYNTDIKYERFVFPDGQDHIKLQFASLDVDVEIITRIANASDLFVLLQATEVLRNSYGIRRITLTIPYLLSARMDRRMNPGEPISLKIVANILNSQNYGRIRIFDPHSDVSLTLIDRSEQITNYDFVSGVVQHIQEPIYLIVPDAGAAKKSTALANRFNLSAIYCSKVRSTVDGYISQVKVDKADLNGQACLIVDDICDGGATFINLAKELKKHHAGKLYLAVSHGIFSKGLDILSDFENVFTTNSYKEQIHHKTLTTYCLW